MFGRCAVIHLRWIQQCARRALQSLVADERVCADAQRIDDALRYGETIVFRGGLLHRRYLFRKRRRASHSCGSQCSNRLADIWVEQAAHHVRYKLPAVHGSVAHAFDRRLAGSHLQQTQRVVRLRCAIDFGRHAHHAKGRREHWGGHCLANISNDASAPHRDRIG